LAPSDAEALKSRKLPVWAFDLLAFNGRDLRLQPLVSARRACRPYWSVSAARLLAIRTFEDGLALLGVAKERGLEGKGRDAPYRSGEMQRLA